MCQNSGTVHFDSEQFLAWIQFVVVFSILLRILVAPSVFTHFYFLGKRNVLPLMKKTCSGICLFVGWLLVVG